MIERFKRIGKKEPYWLMSDLVRHFGLEMDYFAEIESVQFPELRSSWVVTKSNDIAMTRLCVHAWVALLPNSNEKITTAKVELAARATAMESARSLIQILQLEEA